MTLKKKKKYLCEIQIHDFIWAELCQGLGSGFHTGPARTDTSSVDVISTQLACPYMWHDPTYNAVR